MSRRAFKSLLALFVGTAAAAAADLPSAKAPPAPAPLIYSWQGTYLGTQFGYGFNTVSESGLDGIPGYAGLANPVSYTQGYSSRGVSSGFHFGYNRQFGALVLGGEADFDFTGQHTNKTIYNSLGSALGGPTETNVADNLRWSVLGRAGYANDRTLFFLTGGLVNGVSTVEHNYWPLSAPGAPVNDYFNIERFGWTAGAGVEYAFTDDWSGRVEYRHNDYGTAVLNSVQVPGLTYRERMTEDSVRLGISYHVGAPTAPTIAAAPAAAPKKAEPPPPPAPTFLGRLYHGYADEWGAPIPDDPNAPPSRRAGYGPPAASSPPYPFTEWPYGGATPVAVSLPNSIDSPLMKALSPTSTGKFLEDNHIQVYGWIDAGFNVSSARSMPGALAGGNAPSAYSYQPNIPQLDQAVVIIERVPDTVQTDHWDWGFRVSPIYGETYRYTTANGFFSKQLLKWNEFAGYDIPMYYGEVYIPNVLDGLVIRFGRYISMPDIEAQLAPNNYMYSHSMTYVVDGYTNQGAAATLQVNKNVMLQLGLSVGTDSEFQNSRNVKYAAMPGGVLYNPVPGVFATTSQQPAYAGQADPGIKPSFVACGRYQTDDSRDNIYLCANGINTGTFGYNNQQWYGGSYYHTFSDDWHIAIESWHMHEDNVPNILSPFVVTQANPFYYMVNGPNLAQCSNPLQASCTSREWSVVTYLNYKFSPMDNISWRMEYLDDITGQRTGVKTAYFNYAVGWQHWFSPNVEVRPEIAFYNSLNAPAFQQNAPLLQTSPTTIGTKSHIGIMSADVIWHF
jgi:opacity protein-like surface antigen